MKIKLDENLGVRTTEVFRASGHEVATVDEQRLGGASDDEVLGVCVAEARLLVTLDLDFSNPIRFDPSSTAGIAVLRVPNLPGHSDLLRAATVLCDALAKRPIAGRLWVVKGSRVRQYDPNPPP